MSYNCISTQGQRCTSDKISRGVLLPLAGENDLTQRSLRPHQCNKTVLLHGKFEQRTGGDQSCSSAYGWFAALLRNASSSGLPLGRIPPLREPSVTKT